MKWLLTNTKIDPQATTLDAQTALDLAASYGIYDIVQILYPKTLLDPKRQQLLIHAAVRTSQFEVVKWLLEQGMSPTVPNATGKSALYLVLSGKNFQMKFNEPF